MGEGFDTFGPAVPILIERADAALDERLSSKQTEGADMEFGFSERSRELQRRAGEFMSECVYPAEAAFAEQVAARPDEWTAPPVLEELKKQARERGLWNLFLPHSPFGAGLSNLDYAPIAELTGHSPSIAPGVDELRRAGHRQHGAAGHVRHRRSSRSGGSSRCWTGRSGRASP